MATSDNQNGIQAPRRRRTAGTPPVHRPLALCDGRRLLAALDAAATWLEAHRAAIDALNVFPVPDGDTGTNMSMTLTAALREGRQSPAHEAGVIAERAAYGALMGARGNSGVILSQLLRGFARALRDCPVIGPQELSAALSAAAETAGRAVMKPVEGTILTVSAAAAVAAATACAEGGDLLVVLDAALEEARAAVARTPDQLPVLKQAGVVDSGAQGYLIILEGAARYLHGKAVTGGSRDRPPQARVAGNDVRAHMAHSDAYGYCTEFIVAGPHLNVDAVREILVPLGDSTLVVGAEGLVRVHIHTDDPGRVLSQVTPLGRLHRVKIENMQEQHDRFTEGEESDPSSEALAEPIPVIDQRQPVVPSAASTARVGVVAVAPGEGLAQVFRSLGVTAIVPGGQTMNPSTAELLAAIDALPQQEVLLLPNNGNVLLTSEQARTLSSKQVTIVPARTVPQGVAAMVAYLPHADLSSNAVAMCAAAGEVRTGEVTIAVRDAQIDGLVVHCGEVLGLLDDRAVLVGQDREAIALDLMAQMGGEAAEVATVYYGKEVSATEAAALVDHVRERYAALEVEIIDGGQPYYPYIISMD